MNASNFPTSSCDPFYPFYLMTDAPECNIHPPPPPDVMPSPDVPGHWTATSVPPYDGFVPPQPPPRPTSHPSSFNPTAFAYAPVYPPEEGCFVGGGGGDASGATIESGYPLSTSSEQQSDHQTPFLKELSTAPSPTPAPAPPSNANAPADKLEPSPPTPIEDSAISSLLFASGETDAKPSGEQPKHQESLTAGEEFVTPTAVVSPQSQQVQPDVAAPPIANLLTSRKRRRQPFLETVQKYADKLQPVDCVIMIERCYPFSKNTRFMQYFKSHFLHKILSDLNGGHPLDTDYGRDSFTSLYSLHTFEWRKPNLPLTLVCETPVIKEIFVGLDTLLPTTAPRPPSSSSPSEGVPVVPLIRAALNQFEVLNQTRRDGPGDCVRRRHLILVMLSPCLGVASLEAEAAALAGEAVVEEAELAVEDGAVAAAVAAAAAAADEAEGPAARKSRKGVLAQLRELRVAVSAFSPCEHKNLMRLAQMFNMLRPDIRMDTEWPTVVFSRELADNEVSQVSLAQRHQSASSARRALPTHPQQAPSPQQRLQQPPPTVTAPAQSPRLPPQPPLPPQHQQQQQQQPLRHMVATPNDYSAPSPHQTRMPVAMQYANNGNQLAGATNSQPRATLSGPNSIEPPQSHHMQQAAQMSMGLAGPNSVPDAFGGYQTSHASPMAPAYTLVPPSSMESQSARSLHQPMSVQPQHQYYSPMAPPSYENDGARAGLSPAMASDPYLRASYSHSASPMRPATAAPTATTTTTPTAEQQSASGLLGSSESLNHDQLKQQQPVASPYTIQGPPNSVDAGNVPSAPQFHLRQHPSPYQAPQPSPASNNPNPSSTAVGGQYHAPVQSYHISEMSRYQNSASPLNPMRPASTAPGMMMPEDRVIVWEGQLGVRGQAIVHLRLLSDASAPRINLQWQNCANLMLQLEQVERDSHLGQMFLHRMPSYLLQLQLYVAFKNQEHEMALSSRMRSLTPSTFTLGILPPLNSWSSPISPGILAFVCFLATDDGRIIGLVPKDSEIFRGDILNRQLHKRPRLMSEKQQQQQSAFLTQQQQQQQHPQYESNIPEMQQQQQPSPAYSVNSLSLPNTPGKMVRLPAVTAPTPINRVSGPSARLPGSMMDANEMPQPHPTPPQYLQQQQQPRQPPHQVVPSWQDQRQPGMTGDVTQQPQRPYSMMPPTQQQSQFMMQSVAGSQVQQQQHLYHQTGMAMGQSPYAPQVQPKLPPGMLVSQQQQQQRPASGYPSHAPQRQQLRDASGRFQSSSAVAAAASATPMPPEYHTPLPPSYTPAPGAATPVYEYPGMQQTQRMPPTPGYVRTASPMRPGYPQPSNQRMASAYPPGRQPMSVGGRGLPSRGVNMRGPIPQAPTPSHLMMPGDAIMYENHQEQQVAFDPSQAGSAPSQQNLF